MELPVDRRRSLRRSGLVLAIGAIGALVLSLVLIATLYSWSAAAWTASAAWVTAAIAFAAGVIAVGQLAEARRLRLEQAQPYVVVSMELSAPHAKAIDLVVRNLGATAATDISLELEPPPQRAAHPDGITNVWLPESIPVLVPGQEWRTMWDFLPKRAGTDLPDRHRAMVTFKDSQGGHFGFEYVLDWVPYRDRASLVVYGTHEAAKALRELSKTLQRWDEGRSGGLSVCVRDGDARDEQRRSHQ